MCSAQLLCYVQALKARRQKSKKKKTKQNFSLTTFPCSLHFSFHVFSLICNITPPPLNGCAKKKLFAEARAEIVGPTIKYLTPGSTLKLICRVLQSTENPAFIFWYHNNRMINYDVDRGINVSAEAGEYILVSFISNNSKRFIQFHTLYLQIFVIRN